MEKVSIVIPVYNVEKYLQRCLDSILNQTYSDLEVILVNDGSPDYSPQICEEYSKVDERVIVIHKKNGGLSDARNYGLKRATGEFIMFIDSDDYVEKDMVEIALNSIKANNSDVAIWGYYADYLDGNEKLINRVEKVPEARLYDKNFKDEVKTYMSSELMVLLGYAWNKLYRTRYLKDHGYYFTKGLSLVEDIVFNSPILSESNKIIFIDKALVHYIQRPRETLGVKYYPNYFELKKTALEALNFILNSWNVESQIKKEILSNIGFNNLKSTFKSISNTNKTKKEKENLMKNIRDDETTKEILKSYKPNSIKNWLIYSLISSRSFKLLQLIY